MPLYLAFALLTAGGGLYMLLEWLWRGRTHPSMGLAGGVALLLTVGVMMHVGAFWWRVLCGTVVITAVEFAFGAVVNVAFRWNVWDYSDRRDALYGQICGGYCLCWAVLSALIAIFYDLFARYLL